MGCANVLHHWAGAIQFDLKTDPTAGYVTLDGYVAIMPTGFFLPCGFGFVWLLSPPKYCK
jgi:hypothetical protein